GVLNELAGQFAGLSTEKANKAIFDHLKETGALFAFENINHQYPHCWRCKKPIIYRATEQWFCSVDAIKDDAIKAIENVHWIPAWGEGRMINMVRDRSDWCISRQRSWGVPIPMFKCNDCGKYVVNDETLDAVGKLFGEKGSDEWFLRTAEEILPKGFKCPHCGGNHFAKESDIMDVWFDSGVTHAAVLDTDQCNHSWPADLYIEGADQYRGWFQSSLLTSVAWRKTAPYREVCTHGWVVDGEGKKMSKSVGNGMLPSEITDNYGADILRLWVASSDYHSDIRVSKEILKQLSEVYRKIRNTARFILSNLYDFNPDTDMVAEDELFEIDRWALEKMEQLTIKARECYETYEFFTLYHAVHNFCTVDMSNFYLDILKDRLYCEGAKSTQRRAAQTAIYRILRDFIMVVAPMIPFTAEEVWEYIPKSSSLDMESVMYNEMPNPDGSDIESELLAKWSRISDIRYAVNKSLEEARNEKLVGKSLEAKILLYADGEMYDFLNSVLENLTTAFIVSQVEVIKGQGGAPSEIEGLGVLVKKADGEKCERCWAYSHTVGKDADHPTLCARCAKTVKE
ncbi:MAG: class I tRNA ligase family protein, partial [Oscillospiraceae bacterium]